MTLPLMHQIQSAERGLPVRDFSADPRFVPAVGFSLREVSARLLRSTSTRGLRLADRLDHQYA